MIFIDFEYNGVNQRKLNLLCASVNFKGKIKSLWLEDSENRDTLKTFIVDNKHETFVAYNVAAEAHAFISLGLDPLDFKWIDLMLEYKMLQNCNNKYLYGHQLIRGKEKVTQPKPEWYDDLESDLDGTESNKEISDKLTEKYEGKFAEGESNLAACCYRLLNGKKIDTEHKNKMRDLIIKGGPFSEQEQASIIKYCESDVELLPELLKTMTALQSKFPLVEIHDREYRGKVGAITGKLISEGYPVDRQKVEIFQRNIDIAQFNLCESINKQLGRDLFKFNPKSSKHVKNMLLLQEEIHSRFQDAWPLTKTQKYKVDSKTFDKMIPTKYSYKDDDMLEQYIRFNSFDSSVKSLRKSEGDRNFLNYVGPDDRARSWLSPYGAQSGRFQPKSTSFLFLKAAWLRSLCVPKPGRVIIGMDYSQQEFLLGGCISGDKKIWETYQTGDIYAEFGQQVGMITAEKGTAEFKVQRSAAKGAILGISYGMQAKSLARNITSFGVETSDKEAQRIIDAYYELYSDYKKYREQILDDYAKKGYLQLADKWTIYGDNTSKLSLLNVPIQGMGSCILRKAIEFCYAEGLTPIIPLHDALYIEAPLENWKDHAETLRLCMKSASAFYFEGQEKEWAMNVRIDAEAWGSDLDPGEAQLSDFKIKTEKIHVDERAETDYKTFKRYFEPIAESEVEAYKKEVNIKSYVDGKKQISLWN